MSATEKQLAAMNEAAEAKAKRIARLRRQSDREAIRDEILADKRPASVIQAELLLNPEANDEPRRRRFGQRSGSTTTPD